MALTSSAKKAIRVAARKRVFNDRRKKTMKELVKEVRSLVAEKKYAEAKKLLPEAYQAVDKAMKRGVIKKNAAARTKSRLSAAIKKVK
ncbi:30S ribosomal protein S20 [Candidatus Parcubacteria bacterium]|nr:30S ribosomal protein S20 [Candidatus Parcubacteria bacterium]